MSIICFLAYRAITKKSLQVNPEKEGFIFWENFDFAFHIILQFFKDNRDKFMNHDETAGQTKGQTEKYLSDDYR